MSCKDCEDIQSATNLSYFFRWDNANIEIRACPKHAKEVIDSLKFMYSMNITKELTDHKVAVIKAFNSDEWIRIQLNDHQELHIENTKKCSIKKKIVTYWHCDHCAEDCNKPIKSLGYMGKWGEFNKYE